MRVFCFSVRFGADFAIRTQYTKAKGFDRRREVAKRLRRTNYEESGT